MNFNEPAFDVSELNKSFEFPTEGHDDFWVHPELLVPDTTTAVLRLERKVGRTWGNPSAGVVTLTLGQISQKFTVEADVYRVRVSTAGSAGDLVRLTVTTKQTR